MIDPALAFLYFGLPTIVGLVGLAMMKQEERNEPLIAEAGASDEREAIMAEVKSAAAAVASQVASQHSAEIYRRIGTLEERLRGSGVPRLSALDEAT